MIPVVPYQNPFEIIRELRAELAEAKRDAERYRWLRDNKASVNYAELGIYCSVDMDKGYYDRYRLAGEKADKKIDEFMALENKNGD